MVDPELILRGLRGEDRPRMVAILDSIPAFRPEEVTLAAELIAETINPLPTTDYEWVLAERGGRVVGFACFGPVPLTVGTFDLYWIAVDPSLTRLGVASQLDDSVTAQIQGRLGARWLLAETSSTLEYAPARAFYERRGYEVIGRIADYYRPGDDRVTFGKRLDGNLSHVSD